MVQEKLFKRIQNKLANACVSCRVSRVNFAVQINSHNQLLLNAFSENQFRKNDFEKYTFGKYICLSNVSDDKSLGSLLSVRKLLN